MTQFEILADAIMLFKQSRINAAKAQWAKLPVPFQIAILQYVTNAFNISEKLGCDVHFAPKKYGSLILNDQVVADWKTYIPQLVS